MKLRLSRCSSPPGRGPGVDESALGSDLPPGGKQVLLEGTPERAVEAGIVTEAESEDWRRGLEEAERQGTFLFAGMGFIVSGRKPPSMHERERPT